MEETVGRSRRRKAKRKQQIILIGIIAVLMILILTVIVKAFSNKKTKEIAGVIDKNIVQNEENEVLFVEIEQNNIEENIVEENTIEENVVTEENTHKDTSGTRYRLEINCTQNVVNVYEKDENGEYKNCVKVMLCSIGTATPRSGTFGLKKYGWEWKGLQGDVYGQYATQITGNILFHSVPYTEKYNNASLEYWEYDKLGTAASLGCIRLTVKNAKWIYDNCASGTKVMFYENSNPGPLGKPSEQKISSEERYRDWDPTDPNPNNPWRNYTEEKEPEKPVEPVKPEEPDIKDDENVQNEESNVIENDIVNDIENDIENGAENEEDNSEVNDEINDTVTNEKNI